MNAFVSAVATQDTRTETGMIVPVSSTNACVDLFFSIGASRGTDIIPKFVAAYVENKDAALRILQWVRDVRGGAGERQLFRDVLCHLETNDSKAALAVLTKIPEIGRWDDVFAFKTEKLKTAAYQMIGLALKAGNGLAAKWTPRKGKVAEELRAFLGMSPKQYRKTLVSLTAVVEQQMCANDWDNINFSHVPSIAARNYKKAFERHTPKFAEYVQALTNGEEGVKVNANAIFPHDVIKGVDNASNSQTTLDHIVAQWNALPNYVGDTNILPLVDVSGSMMCPVGRGGTTATCLDVSVGLGLYLADKNKGAFNGTFLTFSSTPQLVALEGNIVQKHQQMVSSDWEMSTDLHKAFEKIIETAVRNKVPQSDMPTMLLILSDMQFDECIEHDDSAMQMIERKYADAGYELPRVVFWNIRASEGVPVSANKQGAALVSGYSPSILTSLLSAKMEQFTPIGIMESTINVARYDI